jgi:hypothetical protein
LKLGLPNCRLNRRSCCGGFGPLLTSY